MIILKILFKLNLIIRWIYYYNYVKNLKFKLKIIDYGVFFEEERDLYFIYLIIIEQPSNANILYQNKFEECWIDHEHMFGWVKVIS